jgi:two-component system response regulator NreC
MPEAADRIRIVLADDHVVVRRGLRMLLEAEEGLEVTAEAGEAGEAVAAATNGGADVLLLDLNMPGDPLGALPELAGAGVAAIVLTMERDPAFAERAMEAGASGYLFKDAPGEELIEAIRAAAAGESHVSASVARSMERRSRQRGAAPELTPRETEVLSMIARGHTNGEIAERLALSVRTVETHRTHIQQKLGTSGRPELVRYALEHDLI